MPAGTQTMRWRVVSQLLGAGRGGRRGPIVSFDYGTGAKAPLPERVRAAITNLEGG